MKGKLFKVGNEYQLMNENESITITTRDTVSFVMLALFEDICEYRKGNKELEGQITLETNVLNALAVAQNVIK